MLKKGMNKMGIEVSVTGNMVGASGFVQQFNQDNNLLVPQQFRTSIKFLNIQNTTDNTLKVYSLGDDVMTASPIYEIGSRMVISFKMAQRISEGVKIVFKNDNPLSLAQVKTIEIVWSEISLAWNSSLQPSYNNVASSNMVSVVNTPHVIVDTLPDLNINVVNVPHVLVDNTVNVIVDEFVHVILEQGAEINVANQVHVLVDNPAEYVSEVLHGEEDNTQLTIETGSNMGKVSYCSFISISTHGGTTSNTDPIFIVLKSGSRILFVGTFPNNALSGTNLFLPFPTPLKGDDGISLTLTVSASGTQGTNILGCMGIFE
jgi:hypothetical protein